MNWLAGLFLVVMLLGGPGTSGANWVLDGADTVSRNKATTVSLVFRGERQAENPDFLWIGTPVPGSVLAPDRVAVRDNRVSFEMFVRNYAKDLVVYDPASDGETTISLGDGGTSEGLSVRLEFAGMDGVPVLRANEAVTATLMLSGTGSGIPPSAHVAAYDMRGRMVAGRFYNTANLLAQGEGFRIPAAGKYRVVLKLLSNDLKDMPRTVNREPVTVPFGEMIRVRDVEETTDPLARIVTVMGTRMPVEVLPVTAKVLAEDWLDVVCVSEISNLGKLNGWPFVIDSSNAMPVQGGNAAEALVRGIRLQRLLGSTFARVGVEWRDVQPGPGSYNWVKLHSLLNLYRSGQVRPLVEITGRTAWSRELPTESVEAETAWRNLLREVGKKYRSLIWGVYYGGEDVVGGGEGEWKDRLKRLVKVSAEGFLMRGDGSYMSGPALVLATGKNVKRLIESGVLFGFSEKMIQGVSFDVRPSDDRMGPEEIGLDAGLAELRNELVLAGVQGKIHMSVNGLGWATGPGGCSEALQANYLVRSYAYALKHGAYKVCWYSLSDVVPVPWGGDREERRGLFYWNLAPKLAAASYNLCTFMLSGAVFRGETVQGEAKCFEFDIPVQTNKWPGTVYVAWTEAPGKFQDVLLDMKHGGGVYAMDYSGAEIPVTGADGKPFASLTGLVKIPVGFEPVFIWDAGKPGN